MHNIIRPKYTYSIHCSHSAVVESKREGETLIWITIEQNKYKLFSLYQSIITIIIRENVWSSFGAVGRLNCSEMIWWFRSTGLLNLRELQNSIPKITADFPLIQTSVGISFRNLQLTTTLREHNIMTSSSIYDSCRSSNSQKPPSQSQRPAAYYTNRKFISTLQLLF